MPASYSSVENDTVDYIVWKHYKTQSARVVERVFDANPHLARQPLVLSAGVVINLPDLELVTTTQGVRLWS